MDEECIYDKRLVGFNKKSYRNKGMFDSDFAKSEYIEKDNVVFHVWKKAAHFDERFLMLA